MRCLDDASLRLDVDAREVDAPGGGDELSSPYVTDEKLDVAAWTRDAVVLALPQQLLCRDDCAGLCPACGENLNDAGPDHAHEQRARSALGGARQAEVRLEPGARRDVRPHRPDVPPGEDRAARRERQAGLQAGADRPVLARR